MKRKHLIVRVETHNKFLIAKGMLATRKEFITVEKLADTLITKYIKELEDDIYKQEKQ